MPVINDDIWGTYIHIPKTGGSFITQCLLKIGPRNSHRGQGTHDLPVYYRHHEVWTCVREPAEWLASVWAHRERQAWRRYGRATPWELLCDILADYADGRWNRFVKTITTERPGLVTWFFNIYTPPGVKFYKLGPELYIHLRELGGDPDSLGTKINAGSNIPEIREEHRIMVYNAEKAAYDRYGFPPYPKC